MATAWREYQQKAAAFFRSIDLTATVEHTAKGARGEHDIDVFVEGSYMGIEFKWIVECKAWKTNVSKEKVMALSTIVQDIGADRGFLLSETGFQSGAIRAARLTNIALTGLADLAVVVGDKFVETRVARIHLRIHNVTRKLREIKRERYDGDFFPPTAKPLSKVFSLGSAIDDALRGDLPTPVYLGEDDRVYVNTLDEMLEVAERLVEEAEAWMPP